MKCEEMIKEVYSVAGKLEGLSCYLNHYCNEAVVTMVSDCVDRLEIIGAHLIKDSAPVMTVGGMPSPEEMLKLLGDKKVNIYAERPQEAFGRVYPPDPEDTSDQ